MNSIDVEKAAALLTKRREIQELHSKLLSRTSHMIGLYAANPQEDGTMYDDFKMSNEMGIGLLRIALKANSDALRDIGVDEFAEPTP